LPRRTRKVSIKDRGPREDECLVSRRRIPSEGTADDVACFV
jgi:hypothetical protein